MRSCVALALLLCAGSLLGQCTDVCADGASADHVFIPWLPVMSKHAVGSHLVQVVVRYAGEATVDAIFSATIAALQT